MINKMHGILLHVAANSLANTHSRQMIIEVWN